MFVVSVHVAAVLWIDFGLKPLLQHQMWFGRKYETKVGARDV
jgi:hypothetical protein